MTPFRSVSAGFVLIAALAAPAAAESWTGWSEFYRSFAVEPPPVRPVKLPGIHKVPDVTLKRGVTGTLPKTNVAPKPKSSLDAVPAVPSPVAGWDPKAKKTITGPTDLVDDLVKPGRSAPSANGLTQKPNVHLPGTGSPYSGKYLLETPTHTLRGTGAGDTARSGDVLLHRWQRNGIVRR